MKKKMPVGEAKKKKRIFRKKINFNKNKIWKDKKWKKISKEEMIKRYWVSYYLPYPITQWKKNTALNDKLKDSERSARPSKMSNENEWMTQET